MSAVPGPVAIVSGAASGMGRHMAMVLARMGYRLVLTDTDGAGLQELAVQEGFREGKSVLLQTHDVRDSEGWHALVDKAVERFGAVDLMLNIAGYLLPGNVVDIDVHAIDSHIDINVKGVIYATRAAAQQMVRQKRGHIFNVASIAGLSHVPGMATYCASKHAVRGFSLSVAHELRKHGVQVTVFCPDAVETPMLVRQEGHEAAAMTFGAGRALSLAEVEVVLLKAMKRRPLEVVLDVPRSGRAVGAKLANMFPALTGLAVEHIRRRGRQAQARRR